MTATNERGEVETTEESLNATGQSVSRRTFLSVIATASAAPAMQDGGNQTGGNQTGGTRTEGGQEVETRFELGGRVEGWQGQSPSEIQGETNPTLSLRAGTRYRVVWQNADGVQHNFTILDADGNEITSTDTMANQAETLSLTFTASEEMAQYVCTIHPNTMRGTLQIDGGTQTGDNRTNENQTGDAPAEDGQEVQTRFELGGVIEGWQGRLPEEIEGVANPTLNLQPGTRYSVAWQNADGAPHNFTIQDADGNDIIATRTTSQQDETLSLTFTASEEMAQYVCTIHPNTMQGELQVGGDGVGETDTTGPAGMVGGLAAVTLGSVVGLAYVLARYFEEPQEP